MLGAIWPDHDLLLEIDGELSTSTLEVEQHRLDDARGEHDWQEAVFASVRAEDVPEARSNHAAKREISARIGAVHQRPHRVLARRTAAEVLTCHEDTCADPGRLVQRERRFRQLVMPVTQVVESVLCLLPDRLREKPRRDD